jgi:hypothetical protein
MERLSMVITASGTLHESLCCYSEDRDVKT